MAAGRSATALLGPLDELPSSTFVEAGGNGFTTLSPIAGGELPAQPFYTYGSSFTPTSVIAGPTPTFVEAGGNGFTTLSSIAGAELPVEPYFSSYAPTYVIAGGPEGAVAGIPNIAAQADSVLSVTGNPNFVTADKVFENAVSAPGTAAPRTLSLDILNPHFNPNAGRVLQNFTTYWSDQLAANPALARTVLTTDEYLAAQSSANVARMAYGNAVERLVARDLTDPISSQLFQHIGGPGMPDFVDLTTGWVPGGLLDITTPAGVAGKAGRWYGPGLITPTYTRPAGFTVFP